MAVARGHLGGCSWRSSWRAWLEVILDGVAGGHLGGCGWVCRETGSAGKKPELVGEKTGYL